jgi:hypothetical protein
MTVSVKKSLYDPIMAYWQFPEEKGRAFIKTGLSALNEQEYSEGVNFRTEKS